MMQGERARAVAIRVSLLAFALLGAHSCGGPKWQAGSSPAAKRIIHAEVVAIDQVLVYNRFGANNPYGMVYALKRDVEAIDAKRPLGPCNARLRQERRPRPLVLRANDGDILQVRFENWLCSGAPTSPQRLADASSSSPAMRVHLNEVKARTQDEVSGAAEEELGRPRGKLNRLKAEAEEIAHQDGNRPLTRTATFSVNGLEVHAANADRTCSAPSVKNMAAVHNGISGIAPGECHTYAFLLEREGTHLIFDNAAPAGGEGDGGSLVLGLFGAVNVQPKGSSWYRSQVNAADMALVRRADGTFDYAAQKNGPDGKPVPVLRMLDARNHIVYSDLNAIVVGHNEADEYLGGWMPGDKWKANPPNNFREFTVIFHDELKTVQAFAALEEEQLHSVRDGFGINYGAQGMGALLLASRQQVGPAKQCAECAYEEMFLSSWVNGDPALLAEFKDDPSNVHHSYLGDRVKFRNLHAGPKETHIFHLHAHQWIAQENGKDAGYLDSQNIGPRQGYSYEIMYGGSGNRNMAPGDSIFHCHLYPHFAQGMWELWRVHDVFEDGSRALPDGELGAGTDTKTGKSLGGTPIPAIVPIPGQALAVSPTYENTHGANAMPGYPFYIAGVAGHRAPQPPLDLHQDGGLPRHRIVGGKSVSLPLSEGLQQADLSSHLKVANIELLPQNGTALEKAAMDFHGTKYPGGIPSKTPAGDPATFRTNGLPPQRGAPFADPCSPDIMLGTRDYHVSAIQLDLELNKYGWHDPQARINVLDEEANEIEKGKRKTWSKEPFYFRANSGDCINFFHTNRTPEVLEKDDFQVRLNTDVIGQHIHLVKFDVTSADGSANGFNYEDVTFAKEAIRERREAAKAPGGWIRDENGKSIKLNKPIGYQTSIQRWFADPLLNPKTKEDRTVRTVFTHDHLAASTIQQHGFYSALLIEPTGSKWLHTDKDSNLNCGVGAAARIEPDPGVRSPKSETSCSYKPNGRQAEWTGIKPDGAYREYALAIADFALPYDKPCKIGEYGSGPDCVQSQARRDANAALPKPVNAPKAPEAASSADPGTFVVNYRNEPVPLRIAPNGGGTGTGDPTPHAGDKGELSNVFSSNIHGDPGTPLLPVFQGDKLHIRLIQGAHEETHVFGAQGLRWRRDAKNAYSPWVSAQEVGISEHFEAEIDTARKAAKYADYLYHFGSLDDIWNGAWGLIRTVADNDAGLKRLSNNPALAQTAAAANARWQNFANGTCPKDAPNRAFSVVAMPVRDLLPEKTLYYNKRHDLSDASALLFVLEQDIPAYRSGRKAVEPLVLRANAGDCINVTLKNRLTSPFTDGTHSCQVPDLSNDGDAPRIAPLQLRHLCPSTVVGMFPTLLHYDPSAGSAPCTGKTSNCQVARPGGDVAYEWYAGRIERDTKTDVMRAVPEAFGAVALRSLSDVAKHGAQGLAGALIVEPRGTKFLALDSGKEISSGVSARIVPATGGSSFVEHVLVYQDGLNLRRANALVPEREIADDPEDAGIQAINYRTEPFWLRLGVSVDDHGEGDGAQVESLNSYIFPTDFFFSPRPETPVFKAKAGDRVKFRVINPDGRARMRGFSVFGHYYPDHGLPNFLAPSNSLVGVGKGITADLGCVRPGTWIYRDQPAHIYSGGAWGLLEVSGSERDADRCKNRYAVSARR